MVVFMPEPMEKLLSLTWPVKGIVMINCSSASLCRYVCVTIDCSSASLCRYVCGRKVQYFGPGI